MIWRNIKEVREINFGNEEFWVRVSKMRGLFSFVNNMVFW